MPLILVEGLNCAGKTTYISEDIKNYDNVTKLTTKWANPANWPEWSKRKYNTSSVLWGIYVSLFHQLKDQIFSGPTSYIYLDRSWISSYVYGSIDEECFNNLAELWFPIIEEIVWINTDYRKCLDRFKKSKRNIMIPFDWKYIQENFEKTIFKLADMKYPIQIVDGSGD